MRTVIKLQLACIIALLTLCAGTVRAAGLYQFTSQSKLAKGKWVKINIPESGVYEITYDELRGMGFDNPSKVRVYGQGGFPISEVLNASSVDDIQLVPVMRANNKLYFYANGTVRFSLIGADVAARFRREFNPYAVTGSYFLTEESSASDALKTVDDVTQDDYVNVSTTLGMFYHEKDLVSLSLSGREMLGEDFINGGFKLDYYLSGIADSTIVVNTVVGCNVDKPAFARCNVLSAGVCDTVPFSTSSSRIMESNKDMFYALTYPYAQVKLTHPQQHGQLEPYISFSVAGTKVNTLRLDYAIITYTRSNTLKADEYNQLPMTYKEVTGNEHFQLPGTTATLVVWDINDPYHPKKVPTTAYNDDSGKGRYFKYPKTQSPCSFIAFDMSKPLRKISSYQVLENQNLHGMPVPDLLIITDKLYLEQAQRLADLHHDIDGIDVAVVDQEQVFNEFSSGTRDAMAYRLLCKMLYNRSQIKFKNLLLFGNGHIDNRELFGKHEGTLLSYQSMRSDNKNSTYTTDDFFGFLSDNSGTALGSDKLSIGVGRITCANLDEARSDVDKIVEYYANPDYGVWRNNALSISDSPDEGLYMLHGEYYKDLITNQLKTGMHVTTIHNSQYPRVSTDPAINLSNQLAATGKQMWSQYHKSGMYFTTYVGHAGSISFTKYNNMWNMADVMNTSYKHWPIMSTACCDVARFDSGSHGIADLMFHKRDGGAIALLTSCRNVTASSNDVLNCNFIKGVFSYSSSGKMNTLGEAYKYAKTSFTYPDVNKLMFFLLGDPAIKVSYPLPLFEINKVNGADMTNSATWAQIGQLVKFDIEGQINDRRGQLDESFNGDATLTLYGKEEYFTTVNGIANGRNRTMDIFFNRPKLAEVSGRVVNGLFKGQMIVPEVPGADGDTVLLRVYAHKDNSSLMVNGYTNHISLLPYDEQTAINDVASPVIESMFINDEQTFTNGDLVPASSILYIHASDNEAIDLNPNSIMNLMTLHLDGGKPSYADVVSYVKPDIDGKAINIEYPLNDLPQGLHTLTFTVYDLLGNCTSRSINFVVGDAQSASLVVDKLPATVRDKVNIDVQTDMETLPEFTVRVTDALGKLIWMTKTSSFPVTWNMKDMEGRDVKAGLYRTYGTYSDGINSGGTPISEIIVIDPVKSAAH